MENHISSIYTTCFVCPRKKELLAEIKRLHKTLTKMQQDTLKVVTEWFDVYGGDENEWRRLEQALDLPLTPLSWEAIE